MRPGLGQRTPLTPLSPGLSSTIFSKQQVMVFELWCHSSLKSTIYPDITNIGIALNSNCLHSKRFLSNYSHTWNYLHENCLLPDIDVRNFFTFFIIFIKNAFFNVVLFFERFLFSSGENFYPTKPAKILLNLLNFSIKRLLSDGFNMAVIKILSRRAVALKCYHAY